MSVTLVLLFTGEDPQIADWPLGNVANILATPEAIATWLAEQDLTEEFFLFWHVSLGAPPAALIADLCSRPGDVWHAGLKLGLAGQPGLMDFVNPVWRFNRDPDANLEATSWRISLQACLVRCDVLRKLGGPDPAYATLAGAGLALGHRWIRHGAIMRHIPELTTISEQATCPISAVDEFRFVRQRFGRFWHLWAGLRALATGYFPIGSLWSAWRETRIAKAWEPASPLRTSDARYLQANDQSVAVLIPTLERYPYLVQLLTQLREQTIPPTQIIVVDQTPSAARQTEWQAQFTDLPLTLLWREEPGQCSSRNAGLEKVNCDYVLFLDDDDEIPNNLIAAHLAFLSEHPAEASCGIALERGAGALPEDFTYPRDSDVFPTNNAMLERVALYDSGMFDLAYERGARADGDLGMRLYLAGKQLLLNPAAEVLHLHIPRGGLRHHKARAVTRANSRRSLGQRHLLSPTEGYLWLRYFNTRQVREACLIRTMGTLRGNGTLFQKRLRFLLMLPLLPVTHYQNLQRLKSGRKMKNNYPQIPSLQERHHESEY